MAGETARSTNRTGEAAPTFYQTGMKARDAIINQAQKKKSESANMTKIDTTKKAKAIKPECNKEPQAHVNYHQTPEAEDDDGESMGVSATGNTPPTSGERSLVAQKEAASSEHRTASPAALSMPAAPPQEEEAKLTPRNRSFRAHAGQPREETQPPAPATCDRSGP